MMELYLHFHIHPHGVMISCLSTGIMSALIFNNADITSASQINASVVLVLLR
jgi:hypothetical protein